MLSFSERNLSLDVQNKYAFKFALWNDEGGSQKQESCDLSKCRAPFFVVDSPFDTDLCFRVGIFGNEKAEIASLDQMQVFLALISSESLLIQLGCHNILIGP
jgi:hypothetical protein